MADTWRKQRGGFLEEVIVPLPQSPPSSLSKSGGGRGGVHLVGKYNSGYLATMLLRGHPPLATSLALLNATPVWGLNLPGWEGR